MEARKCAKCQGKGCNWCDFTGYYRGYLRVILGRFFFLLLLIVAKGILHLVPVLSSKA